MNAGKPCRWQSVICDHFKGTIDPQTERDLRAHLPDCESCRAYYERHLLLAELDPQALDARERISRGLGLRARPGRIWIPVSAFAAAAAAVLLLILFWPQSTERQSGLVSRGPALEQTQVSLSIYRLRPGQKAEAVSNEIDAGDELAFAYENKAGRKRLMVFAVDENKKIYWYHPAWRNPGQDPVAIRIETSDGLHELPEAISHTLTGKNLWIHAIFTDQAMAVKEVEALMRAQNEPSKTLPLKNAEQKLILLKVRH